MAIKKPKLFTMKVDEVEKSRWQKLAKSFGVSLSELIRVQLDDLELPKQNKIKHRQPPEVDPVLMRKISGAVNNLNQISRRVNEGQKFDVAVELASINAQLEAIRYAHQIH